MKTFFLTYVPKEYSDQSAPRRSLIRVFVRMKEYYIIGYPKCVHWSFWSACAKAQADPNLRWTHMSHVICLIFLRHYPCLSQWSLYSVWNSLSKNQSTDSTEGSIGSQCRSVQAWKILLNGDLRLFPLTLNFLHFTQTVQPLIRRRVLQRLIWVWTVCQCPSLNFIANPLYTAIYNSYLDFV